MSRVWQSDPFSTSSSKLKRSVPQMNPAKRFAPNEKEYARLYFINKLYFISRVQVHTELTKALEHFTLGSVKLTETLHH
jgi:hypothetical protein